MWNGGIGSGKRSNSDCVSTISFAIALTEANPITGLCQQLSVQETRNRPGIVIPGMFICFTITIIADPPHRHSVSSIIDRLFNDRS
jgi:hypothetical protein